MTAGTALNALIHRVLAATATQIFGGNVTVLDDIGRQTARFVSTFLDPAARTDAELERFLAPLRTGPTDQGGQELLRTAYRHYLEVARTPPSDERDERMLTANLLAILHEHHRLDPYIDAAMPRSVRPLVTPISAQPQSRHGGHAGEPRRHGARARGVPRHAPDD